MFIRKKKPGVKKYKVKSKAKNRVRDFCLISTGIILAGLGLNGFLLPNSFIDGGVMGISILTTAITKINLSILIIIINIPFIILGYYQVSKIFALKTSIAIGGLALCLVIIPYPIVTDDKLLISVFGGICIGGGIGLAIRGGCVIDGTEVLALYLSKKFSASVGDIILLINILIFSTATILFGIEVAFYSILTYLSASKTVDFVIEGIEEYIGITIISESSEKIQQAIIENLKRGITVYKGTGGYGKRGDVRFDLEIIFTVITRLEISRLIGEINAIDENAFVVQHSINDIQGGMVKRRPLQ